MVKVLMVAEVIGFIAIVLGVALLSIPAACIVGGVLLVVWANLQPPPPDPEKKGGEG